MKKSILLGAAALAAIALAAPQTSDAGEVKIGGYYQFRAASMDNTPGDVSSDENANLWGQRLQLNIDMKASEKSHAHLVTRPFDGAIGGADSTVAAVASPVAGATSAVWNVRQLWLETEAWNVGVKVGNMPIAMNDGLLFDHDTTGYSTILLAKNFGGVTLVGADVKVAEGSGTTIGAGINHKDVDFFILSALGKLNNIDYQLTGAYLNSENRQAWTAADLATYNAVATAGTLPAAYSKATPFLGFNGTGMINSTNRGVHDGWIALTLGTTIEGINLTGTGIYETGMTNVSPDSQLGNDGFMLGGRAKGKTGFGGWNLYAFYGAEDFTAAVPGGNETNWSPAWDSKGVLGQDLMMRALTTTTSSGGLAAGNNGTVATSQSNMWGIGGGLAINAGAWTIKPSLDYAHLAEENINVATADVALNAVGPSYSSAWGGTLGVSTKIQEATTLDLSGTWVKPQARVIGGITPSEETMHYLQASVKMDF